MTSSESGLTGRFTRTAGASGAASPLGFSTGVSSTEAGTSTTSWVGVSLSDMMLITAHKGDQAGEESRYSIDA